MMTQAYTTNFEICDNIPVIAPMADVTTWNERLMFVTSIMSANEKPM